MTDGWLMDAVEAAGWVCGEDGCVLDFGHDDPKATEHPTPHSSEPLHG